jgi:hypothetical protein
LRKRKTGKGGGKGVGVTASPFEKEPVLSEAEGEIERDFAAVFISVLNYKRKENL